MSMVTNPFRPQVMHLGLQAIEIIREQHQLTGQGRYGWPSRRFLVRIPGSTLIPSPTRAAAECATLIP